MAITREEVIKLENGFHHCSMIAKGTAAEQARFFPHPEPRIIVLHGEDITLQKNYEIHQALTDEMHRSEHWEVTPLSDDPERVRAVGRVYWQGRPANAPPGTLLKCYVGEDWIVQRVPSGDLKIALYINTYHQFLPDSAPMNLR